MGTPLAQFLFLSGACSWPESPHQRCRHTYTNPSKTTLLVCTCSCHKARKRGPRKLNRHKGEANG